jgi:hypothetical protein
MPSVTTKLADEIHPGDRIRKPGKSETWHHIKTKTIEPGGHTIVFLMQDGTSYRCNYDVALTVWPAEPNSRFNPPRTGFWKTYDEL